MAIHSEYLTFALDTAIEAGNILNSFFGKISSIKTKSNDIDLLTQADLESEKYIINKIQKYFPKHSILSEERDRITQDSEFCWIIDPLDGTTNFFHNLPIFSVSIGLQYKSNTILGVVNNPAVDKTFYASINNGAFMNEQKINASKINTLKKTLLVTGFPYKHDDKWDLSFDIFKDFYNRNQGMRRLGAASLDLCFVAMGRFDGFYEFNLLPWDICAGELIVREAGGQTSDWNGSSLPNTGKRILATNGLIHKEMITVLSQNKYQTFFN